MSSPVPPAAIGSLGAVRCILIGGRSNVGKSSVAAHLAAQLGWTNASTDKLGRHPGRPWGIVPDHVVAHYTSLDDAAILSAVVAHQRGMWPKIEALVREHAEDTSKPGLVLEGSAVMPEDVATLGLPGVAAVWLTASDAFLRDRIEIESGYDAATPDGRHLIDRFIERNNRLDAVLRSAAREAGLPFVNVEGRSVAEVADACIVSMARLR
jgi:2-phosphoglycerate kinase